MLPGDTIDFAVGYGNGNYFGDSTGLAAQIEFDGTDIHMLSAQLQAGNTVQFTYETTGNPGPFEVGLYRSTDGITYNPADRIDTQTITPSTSGGQGTGTFQLPPDLASDPDLPYLLVVADPSNSISETDENNNTASILLQPDIAPTSLTWNTAQGGVDFSYRVTGAALPQDAAVFVYWASGPTENDILDLATGSPITISTTTPLDTPITEHILPTDLLTLAPAGTTHLVVVVDPDNRIDEGVAGEQNNVFALLYDPKVTVTAKYDGDPSDTGMGRYFSGTDVLKDNYFTVKLSDSLDALRPTVQVQVGGQLLAAAPSPTTADTFITTVFDPGSLLAGNIALTGRALIQGHDASDFTANLLVEPLPGWVKALDPKISFDANGNGPGTGAYVFDGFLPDLSLGGRVFTIPTGVPLIGGQELKAKVGFEVSTVAPLAVSSTPTVEAGLQANLTLGDSVSFPVFTQPLTAGVDNDKWSFTVTPGATLDPVTLDSPNGFSLTVAFDTKSATLLQATLFDATAFVFPFGIPTELEFKVEASLNVMLHAHAQIAYDGAHGLEFLPGGTYLGLGIGGDLSATAQAGWFPPAWVQRLFNSSPGHFSVGVFALRDVATLSLNMEAESHFGGTLDHLRYTGTRFTGSANFSDKLDLLFQIGDFTVFDIVIADLNKKGPIFSWSVVSH